MAQLRYKTRGESSPQGKPRVYFACHPREFAAYWDAVSEEILTVSNCAIYYYDPAAEIAQDEDYYLNLRQMQLLVIPVTERFLTENSRAKDTEFAYAVDHHIPVLPLMQEPNLEDLFNEICGDRQFLDKNNTDDTAIRYEDKLKKFLNSVLVGDELAQKVRQAFDAYIFLSYRKKDRRYAQELMRLIHRSPQCRDLAIWYDEFLVPGENFNVSIQEALEKSELFVLTVTPNLVNETNYIMTTEYPMASAAGKPIIPVEMVKTDRYVLQQRYTGIPQVLLPENEAVFTNRILTALQSRVCRKKDDAPTHDYLMGLAYLSGIDVEVDHAYAVERITSAAEAGQLEAMEKLATMYGIGEGVAVDYDTSIQWRMTRMDALRELYDSTGEENVCYAYTDAVKDVIRQLVSHGKSAYALDIALEMADILPRLLQNAQIGENKYQVSVDMLYCITEGFRTISNLCFDVGQIKLAESYHKITCNFAEQLTNISGAFWTCELLADCCREYGKHAEYTGDSQTAQFWYGKALNTLERAARETDLQEAWEKLSNVCESISFDFRWDDVNQRSFWLTKAAEAKEYLYYKCGHSYYASQLTEIYRMIINLYSKEGNQEACRSWTQRMEGVLTGKSQAEGMPADPWKDLKVCLQIADASVDSRDYDNAMVWYQRANQLVQEWTFHKDKIRLADIEAKCKLGMGKVRWEQGDPEDARRYWEAAVAIWERLVASDASEKTLEKLCEVYTDVADLYKEYDCPIQLRAYWIKKAETLEQIIQYGDKDSFYVPVLTGLYRSIGDLYLEEDNEAQAQHWYDRCIFLLKQCVAEAEGSKASYALDLARGYFLLGTSFQSYKKYEKAERWYQKAAEILNGFREPNLERSRWKEQDSVYRSLGEVYAAQKKYEQAKKNYCLACEILDRLRETDDSVLLDWDAAHLCEVLAMLCEETDDFDEAAQWLKKLLDFIKILKERGCVYNPQSDILGLCEMLGIAYLKKGDWVNAKYWYYQYLEICLERNKANDNDRTKRSLFKAYYLLGEACEAMEMHDEAGKWYKASYAVFESLRQTADVSELRKLAADSCKALGDIFYKQKQMDEAKSWCAKAMEGYAELAKQTRKLPDYEHFAEAAFKLGVLTKDPQKLRAAGKIYSQLADMCPDEPRYRYNAKKIEETLKKYFYT